MKLCIIIRTDKGRTYSRRIGQELGRYVIQSSNGFMDTFLSQKNVNCENTFFHLRTAYPYRCKFIDSLYALENEGYLMANSVDTIRLTSNKMRCAEKLLNAGMPHPKTKAWQCSNSIEGLQEIMHWFDGKAVIKPCLSNGNGSYVRKINSKMTQTKLANIIAEINADKVVPYIALHRVIVLNGEPLDFVFTDRPTDKRWQVSVCLNKKMSFIEKPQNELLEMAVKAQGIVGGVVNYIDIFETTDGYVMGEINTSCNLSIHEKISGRNIAAAVAKTLYEYGTTSF